MKITLRHSDTPYVQRRIINFRENSFSIKAMVGELTCTQFRMSEISRAE